MDAMGINAVILLIQVVPILLLIGLPITALIGLSKKKLSGTPLALWVLVICVIPFLGALAYWIVKPTTEGGN
jgi:hypothetical protein